MGTFYLKVLYILHLEYHSLYQVIPEPTMPEWTAEARDVQELVQVLMQRYEKACARAQEIRVKHGETTVIAVPSNVCILHLLAVGNLLLGIYGCRRSYGACLPKIVNGQRLSHGTPNQAAL